jgi:predicted acylesterase/phospholipase RssA
VDSGIRVNQYLETNQPGIFAAGDVANFYDPIARKRSRAEHWDNAIKQGRIAALNMLGERQSWRTVSYFFSDVFDLTFNVVGSTKKTGERIVRGSVEDRSFSVLYLGNNRLHGAFLLEQSFLEAKAAGALIANRSDLAVTKAKLPDSRFPLNRAAVQTVLILQGGGALGAFECGVVKALEERSIYPDLVAGVSIGAFNAAIIAANPRNATAALEAFWRELSLDTPDVPFEELRRALSSLQSLVFGAPRFFRPRWFEPILTPAQLPTNWTSFYDPSPLKATLRKYVAFKKLRDSPVRLVLSAVDVETSQLTIFDSYVDEITPEHVLASGSLPPAFPWTSIEGKHYWDGGLVSNSPLDQVVEVGGLTDKNIYVVNLWLEQRALPRSIPEVLARRDEVLFAEKIRRNIRIWQRIDDYRRLVEEIMAGLESKTAEQIKRRPHYIEAVGETCPLSITRTSLRRGRADRAVALPAAGAHALNGGKPQCARVRPQAPDRRPCLLPRRVRWRDRVRHLRSHELATPHLRRWQLASYRFPSDCFDHPSPAASEPRHDGANRHTGHLRYLPISEPWTSRNTRVSR